MRHLLRQRRRLRGGVAHVHTEEHHISPADGPDNFPFDHHTRLGDALHQRAHRPLLPATPRGQAVEDRGRGGIPLPQVVQPA